MLLTRVLTAIVLLVLLLAVLYSESFPLFIATCAAFLAGGVWEGGRLFRSPRPVLGAVIWTGAFVAIVLQLDGMPVLLFALCVVLWALRFVPALALGLPAIDSVGNRLVQTLYSVAVLGCFVAIVVLFGRSPLYLVSVMAIVWIADIGAYFAGKAFGRRKLAPSISPGKSWEGAFGGWLLVLALAGATVAWQPLQHTFAPSVQASLGWAGFVLVMTLLVAASVVGDLFESMLKRRAGMKDSSGLLPGHGGILDRIDALIPVLPMAVLVSAWL